MRLPKFAAVVLGLIFVFALAGVPGCGPPDPVETVREHLKTDPAKKIPPIDRFERLEDDDGSQRVRGHVGKNYWDFWVKDGKMWKSRSPETQKALEAFESLSR